MSSPSDGILYPISPDMPLLTSKFWNMEVFELFERVIQFVYLTTQVACLFWRRIKEWSFFKSDFQYCYYFSCIFMCVK